MTMVKKIVRFSRVNITNFILLLLVLLGLTFKWYHSFGVRSISYGSGDAFGLILDAINLENYPVKYLSSYLYRVYLEVTGLSSLNLSYYFTPILASFLLIFIFKILEKHVNVKIAIVSCFLIVTNPWISYYSTEPSKALFVLFFYMASLFFMYRYKQSGTKKELLFSFIFLSFSSIFYHSAFLFYPIYFILFYINIYKNIDLLHIKKFIKTFMIFAIIFIIISGPFFVSKFSESHNKQFETEYDDKYTIGGKQNLVEIYASAIYGALIHPEYLGLYPFLNGICTFLVYDWVCMLFLFSTIILLISHFALNKKRLLMDFIFIFISIFTLISIQWVASSHGSRYPQYVILFLYIILGYFLIDVFDKIKSVVPRFLIILLIFIAVLTPLSDTYSFKYVEGYRNIYIPHLQTGDLILKNNISINQENQILYLGWPGITISMQNIGMNDDYFHTFGWGATNLTYLSSVDNVIKNNISYYIYTRTGTDYFNSSEEVFTKLNDNFNLIYIDGTKNERVKIYKIEYDDMYRGHSV